MFEPQLNTWKLRPEVLLCANTVKPLHGLVPRTILGQAWWDKTRKESYASTNFHCIACGVAKLNARIHKWLEGHEIYTLDYALGRAVYVETVPLCHFCHNYIHDGRLLTLVKKGEIKRTLFDEIMKHGNAVLKAAKRYKTPPYTGTIAEWERWRLVLFGIEYGPIYRTYKEWLAKFGDTWREDDKSSI